MTASRQVIPLALPVTVVREHTVAVRERHFRVNEGVFHILSSLIAERTSGTLMVDLSEGGVCSIRFREEEKLAE